MITSREMFCTFIGVITTHKEIPRPLRNMLLFESGKEFGIQKDEVAEILKEMEKTLSFVCDKLGDRINKRDNSFFDNKN